MAIFTLIKGLRVTDEYWDCECEENYIHHYTEEECHHCGTRREDQPPSRIEEVLEAGFALMDEDEKLGMKKQVLLDVTPIDSGEVMLPADHALLGVTADLARLVLARIEKAKECQAADPDFVYQAYRASGYGGAGKGEGRPLLLLDDDQADGWLKTETLSADGFTPRASDVLMYVFTDGALWNGAFNTVTGRWETSLLAEDFWQDVLKEED